MLKLQDSLVEERVRILVDGVGKLLEHSNIRYVNYIVRYFIKYLTISKELVDFCTKAPEILEKVIACIQEHPAPNYKYKSSYVDYYEHAQASYWITLIN